MQVNHHRDISTVPNCGPVSRQASNPSDSQNSPKTQSSSFNRNPKDKFKLSRKNIVFEKPDTSKRKPNISICSPSMTTSDPDKLGAEVQEKSQPLTGVITNGLQENATKCLIDVDVNRENISKPEKAQKIFGQSQETDITDRVRLKFNRAMNDKLDELIKQLGEYNARLDEGRRIVRDRIADVVRRSFQGSVFVKEYGSYATKLLTPFSDMDLSIQGCAMFTKEQVIEVLQMLCDNLQLCEFIRKATPIFTAAVPVVKIEADPSFGYENSICLSDPLIIEVDIVVDTSDGINPIGTALRTTEYIKYCIVTYPSFFKNMLLLKYMMSCHDLSNTYRGGLCSYALSILYVAFIESHNLTTSADNFFILRKFLSFLSTKFNSETQAVYFGVGCK